LALVVQALLVVELQLVGAIPYFHQLLLREAARAEQILLRMLQTGEAVEVVALQTQQITAALAFLGRVLREAILLW
jgi:hypothetical protein